MNDGVTLRVISVSCHFSFLTEQLRRVKVNISVPFFCSNASCTLVTNSNYFELVGRFSAPLGLASAFSLTQFQVGDSYSFVDKQGLTLNFQTLFEI